MTTEFEQMKLAILALAPERGLHVKSRLAKVGAQGLKVYTPSGFADQTQSATKPLAQVIIADGIDTVKALIDHDLPILVYTAQSSSELQIQVQDLGAMDILWEGVSEEEFPLRLQQAIQQFERKDHHNVSVITPATFERKMNARVEKHGATMVIDLHVGQDGTGNFSENPRHYARVQNALWHRMRPALPQGTFVCRMSDNAYRLALPHAQSSKINEVAFAITNRLHAAPLALIGSADSPTVEAKTTTTRIEQDINQANKDMFDLNNKPMQQQDASALGVIQALARRRKG